MKSRERERERERGGKKESKKKKKEAKKDGANHPNRGGLLQQVTVALSSSTRGLLERLTYCIILSPTIK